MCGSEKVTCAKMMMMVNMCHDDDNGGYYPNAGDVGRHRNTASAANHVEQTGGEKRVLLGIASALVVLVNAMHKSGRRSTHPHARVIVT